MQLKCVILLTHSVLHAGHTCLQQYILNRTEGNDSDKRSHHFPVARGCTNVVNGTTTPLGVVSTAAGEYLGLAHGRYIIGAGPLAQRSMKRDVAF